jgi:hypothetical protein
MSGFVYILSNPSMPGLLKIGSTEKLPTERASQLYSTGVPEPFKVEFAVWCENHQQAERKIHEELDDCRISDGREFFLTSVSSAIQVTCNLCECFGRNNTYAVDRLCFVDFTTIESLQVETGVAASAERWLESLLLTSGTSLANVAASLTAAVKQQ